MNVAKKPLNRGCELGARGLLAVVAELGAGLAASSAAATVAVNTTD